jgi:outer membrane protein OmpA-like peptidoglycan-associated protein
MPIGGPEVPPPLCVAGEQRRTEIDVYDFDDDDEGRGRGRVAALVVVLLLGAGGWFFARPALSNSDDGRGGSGAFALDATSSTTTSSSSTTPLTTAPAAATTASVTTARIVREPTTISTAPPSTAPVRTSVTTTEPPAVPVATLPDGNAVPAEIQLSSSEVVLTGTVPSQQAVDRLVFFAETIRLIPGPTVNNLTVNPAVPDSVAVRIVERNAIVFNEGSHTVHEDHARQIDRFVEILNTFPQATVQITAHADQRNDAERNEAISIERAEAVAAYVVSRGVDPGRVSALGAGESDPLVVAETDEAHAVNRRVDFMFTGLLSG